MRILTNVNLNNNELQNVVIHPRASSPSGVFGKIYANNVTNKLMWFNGTQWRPVGSVITDSTSGDGLIEVDGENLNVYTLPVASDQVLGGIKLGAGLSVDTLTGIVSVTNVTDNNYTNEDKLKLAGIESGAEVNVNANWNATSGDALILNKPTKLSDFINDEDFVDTTVSNLVNYYNKTDTYSKVEVNELIGSIATIQIQVVTELQPVGKSNIIYLVSKSGTEEQNIYYEYLWTGTGYEKIGDTEIDLSNYLTKTGNGENVVVNYITASSRALPTTGENLGILIGKITKYLYDLKTVSFTSSYTDLINLPTLVEKKKGTISTLATSVTISKTSSQDVLGIFVKDSVTNEQVICDSIITSSSVRVFVTHAPTNPLSVLVALL